MAEKHGQDARATANGVTQLEQLIGPGLRWETLENGVGLGENGSVMLGKTNCLLSLVLLAVVGQMRVCGAEEVHYIGRFPKGSVELVGVTNYPPTKQSHWWLPDGSPAQIEPFLIPKLHQRLSRAAVPSSFAFLVQFKDLPADASWPTFWHDPSPWWCQQTGGTPTWEACLVDKREMQLTDGVYTPQSDSPATNTNGSHGDGNGVLTRWLFLPTLDRSVEIHTIFVGVSMGEWETVIRRKPNGPSVASFSRDGQEWTVKFLKPPTKTPPDTTQVRIKTSSPPLQPGLYNSKDLKWLEFHGKLDNRLVAVDNDGKEYSSPIRNSVATFDKLPLSSLKEYRFQVRPFSWVAFENVSLNAGQAKPVTVSSSADSEKPAK